jgi:RNA polymerase sigma-70 factor (ECF subfamily)
MESAAREMAGAPADAEPEAGGAGETSLAVREALSEMPEDQRACLVLRVQEELSYSEIARATGVAVGTVMSRLSRARTALRERLKARAVL